MRVCVHVRALRLQSLPTGGAGGRMSMHRHPTESSLYVDMGAQYISRFQSLAGSAERGTEYEKTKEELYDELLASQVLAIFPLIL